MSFLQMSARFENLVTAYADTQAEIRAHVYPSEPFAVAKLCHNA